MVLALTAALLSGGVLNPARARHRAGLAGSGDPFTLTFDEHGNGIVDLRDGTGPHPLSGTLGTDPSRDRPRRSSTYLLPQPVITGDIPDPEDFLGGTLGDVLRFTNANGGLDGGPMVTG